MTEYRDLPAEAWGTFVEYTAYAFSPEAGPTTYDPERHQEGRDFGDRRGLYPEGAPADADPLCVCQHYWTGARIRGETHPAPGIAAVATPPEHRRQGYVGRLLEASLAEYRDRGARFSILWPFRYRFYRQFGWDTGARRTVTECPPDALAVATDRLDEPGTYEPVPDDEIERVEPVYERHLGGYGLALERSGTWWRERVFDTWHGSLFCYAWECADEVRGYLVYGVEEADGERTMTVREVGYLDHEAYLALLAFCYGHDSQVDRVRFWEPVDSPLLSLVPDPEALTCTLELGPMVRVVDVARTLSALTYPSVDRRVTVAVDDPLADWNDGTFTLAVEDGAAGCEPTAAAPDCRLGIAALSQLAVGFRSARELARGDRLVERTAGALEALEALFPPESTYLGEKF